MFAVILLTVSLFIKVDSTYTGSNFHFSISENPQRRKRSQAAEADQKALHKMSKRNAFQYGKQGHHPTAETLASLHTISTGGDKILNMITQNQRTIDIIPIGSKNTETTRAIGMLKVTKTMVIVTIIKDTRIDKTIDGKINDIRLYKGDRINIEEVIEATVIDRGLIQKDLRGKINRKRRIEKGQIVVLRIRSNLSITRVG